MAKTTQIPTSYVPTPDYPGENIFQASRRRRSEQKAFEEYQKQQEALRQQYLYDKTIPAEVLPEGVLGPAMPESKSMNPFLKSMRDSGVPEPVVQFLQNNPQATKEDIQAALDITSKMAAQSGGRGDYYVPIQTAGGVQAFDTRKGEFKDPNKTVIGSSSDPNLQGRISGAKTYGKQVGEESADVGRSIEAISSITDAMNVLDKGIYSGFYGKAQLAAAKALPGFDKKKAANTEEFISHIGNTVIPRLKEFGGSDTVEEMKYLQQVQAGNIELEMRTIRNVLNKAERKLIAKQQRLKRQASTVGLESKVDAALTDVKPSADNRKAREEAALRALRGR